MKTDTEKKKPMPENGGNGGLLELVVFSRNSPRFAIPHRRRKIARCGAAGETRLISLSGRLRAFGPALFGLI